MKKIWQTPKVYRLGVENTASTSQKGQFEGTTHLQGFHTVGSYSVKDSVLAPVGYAS